MQERTYATPSPRSFACDLATLCAPTLAGLKPASLFRYQPAPGQDAAAMAAAWHTELSPRGVTVQVLKQCPRTGAVLVYVYRPARRPVRTPWPVLRCCITKKRPCRS